MGLSCGGSSPLLGTFGGTLYVVLKHYIERAQSNRLFIKGRLAQLVERPVYIRQVGGSSPSAATNFQLPSCIFFGM